MAKVTTHLERVTCQSCIRLAMGAPSIPQANFPDRRDPMPNRRRRDA